MAIDKELEAKILRYHHVEKWKVGTISRQLGVHHDVVDRVLSQAGLPKVERSDRPTMIDPYLPFIMGELKLISSRFQHNETKGVMPTWFSILPLVNAPPITMRF